MYKYKCGKCDKELPREAYHRDPSGKGHFSICKKCRASNRDVSKEMIRNTRSRAKRKGLEFNLTREYIVELNKAQDGKCVYTGIELDWEVGNYPGKQRVCTPERASVDRIDPNKGYTVDNIQLVCDFVNRIKAWYSDGDIYKFCTLVIDNIKQ